ncbi:MAG: hypothetical protein QXV84_00650 [Conexivisphaerales archaeon]
MISERAAVYGTSHEGYEVAMLLSDAGYKTNIIDERMKTAYLLGKDRPRSIKELLGEDTLYPIQPLAPALTEAGLVVIAPRLRYSDEGRGEWIQRLKEVGQNISKTSIIVNFVPMTFGGNREAISIIEEQSGLKANENFTYIYAPANKKEVASYIGRPELAYFAEKILGKYNWINDIEVAETLYAKLTISKYLNKALEAAVYRDSKITTGLAGNVFLDDMADDLYEIQLFADTLPHGDTMQHYAAGSLKAVNNYLHTLESFLRLHSREKGLKAIRSRILIVWSFDSFDMKGEKPRLQNLLLNSLSEVFGEVDSWNPEESGEERRKPPSVDKYQIIIACSKSDLRYCTENIRKNDDQSIISASIPIGTF